MQAGLFHHLGRAKLDSTLLLISDAIRGMFGRKEPIMHVPVLRSCGPLRQKGKVTITAWDLSDLAYLAIRESNDFQPWEPSVHDLVGLCNFFLNWHEDQARTEFEGLSNDDSMLKFAVGFGQKQFWYQETRLDSRGIQPPSRTLRGNPVRNRIRGKTSRGLVWRSAALTSRRFVPILFGLFSLAQRQGDLGLMTFDGTASNVHPALTAWNVPASGRSVRCGLPRISSISTQGKPFLRPSPWSERRLTGYLRSIHACLPRKWQTHPFG